MDIVFGSWSVLTTNFLFVLYIALCSVVFSSVLHLANGQWRFQVRDIACSLWVLFALAGFLLAILLSNGEATFQWLAHAHDEGNHLPGWHNYTFLVLRQIAGFAIVATLFSLFIKYQRLSETDSSYKAQRRFRNIALLIPFFYISYASMVAWDFEMTMLPGWHSASYAFYHFQSNFHCFLAFFTILLFFLYQSGKLNKPFESHIFNFMAQFMLAMTILYTYLYFTQYLIMWYGRLPGEMGRYFNMMYEGYAGLWWSFLVLKFIIPFVTLAITPNRHNPVIIVMVAFSIVIGTWIERYTWIAGSLQGEYHIPMTSLFDVAVTAVIFVAGWTAVRWNMRRKGLVSA
ncbi:MAG: Uncharacterized protein FD165_1036 [Gammaproteobacteria bacterium]|nr:MAG: Uncharacterized protein FD165_1036 [Gammaproteobacteria bacterium]TND06256.1 MAG: Uncharacterized protein FD120_743 [Gammaproteobacteria bacterium]